MGDRTDTADRGSPKAGISGSAGDRVPARRPFLYNSFTDPAMIALPTVLRLPLAWLIAARRAPAAGRIYAQLGGASPLLDNTQAQAVVLERMLGDDYRCFIAMRYWHPLT